MKPLRPTANITEYLEDTQYVASTSAAIADKAESLSKGCAREAEKVAACFEYVRDCIAHTVDIGESTVVKTAEDVLALDHGTCYTKSMLLVALLRNLGIPSGFCYQRLCEEEGDDPHFFLHSLAAYCSDEQGTWIRLDVRGGSKDTEAPAVTPELVSDDYVVFHPDQARGEIDYLQVLPRHPEQVVAVLEVSSNCIRMIEEDLPTVLDESA
ncbi:transglutaminase-like domain-containing protein [Raoultibacter phocaeensis]|uniref:transglutaminase-like domain-containing protein n=1 Tax=Raoultibacter phocaeensis TaxID=2479841 RepID=UPI001119793C|nr:transglutaminase family protein [Raoultibacter phocaeensis]